VGKIDLNCDLGESYGRFKLSLDEEVMKYISSANIACGFHAGDPVTIRRTVRLAVENNVEVGAHPGLPDLLGFGRRWIETTPEEIENYIIYQIGALEAFAKVERVKLLHVKPHGALYNKAADDERIAEAIIKAIKEYDENLILVGLANSKLIEISKKYDLRYAAEAFADRAYDKRGRLVSRKLPGAVITDPNHIVKRAVEIVEKGEVETINGEKIKLGEIHTICVHGDNPRAVEIAKILRKKLIEIGIEIKHMAEIVK